MVGAGDHALLFHFLDDPGGPVVADLQVALDEAGGGLALLGDDRHRPVEQAVAFARIAAAGPGEARHVLHVHFVGDLFHIGGFRLFAQVVGDLLDLAVADERPVHARDAPTRRHIEHVALPEQLFRALLAQDGAAVDLRRDLEADAGREVGLDGAGDHVHRGALGGHDDVDAGRARHLRQALDRGFHLFSGDQHQVGHFVDDDDDIGQRRQVEGLFLVDRLAGRGLEAGLHGPGERLALARGFDEALVVAGDIAHRQLAHGAVAVLHLAHGPLQGHHRLAGVRDHGRQQMRDAVVA